MDHDIHPDRLLSLITIIWKISLAQNVRVPLPPRLWRLKPFVALGNRQI